MHIPRVPAFINIHIQITSYCNFLQISRGKKHHIIPSIDTHTLTHVHARTYIHTYIYICSSSQRRTLVAGTCSSKEKLHDLVETCVVMTDPQRSQAYMAHCSLSKELKLSAKTADDSLRKFKSFRVWAKCIGLADM